MSQPLTAAADNRFTDTEPADTEPFETLPLDTPSLDPVVARALAPVGGYPDDDNWPSASPGSERATAGADFASPGADTEPPAPPAGEAELDIDAQTELDTDGPLTPRQEAFADAYARAPNGAAAAREAGYAHASAKVAASRNLRRSGVLLRIMARRQQQAVAREAQRARIAGILEEALTFARRRENPGAMARVAALLMRLEGLDAYAPADDRMLSDANEDQLQSLLACFEIAGGCADAEVPNPNDADIEELATRASELMQAARDKARGLAGVRAADCYLKGLLNHLDVGVRGAVDACSFARMLDEAVEASPDPWARPGAGAPGGRG